jgi:putative transcriptional regulator
MGKRALRRIRARLRKARTYFKRSAEKPKYPVRVPEQVDVRKIRARLGLSQEAFAATYGFALSAVRDWEHGRRQPKRSARMLLNIVDITVDAMG